MESLRPSYQAKDFWIRRDAAQHGVAVGRTRRSLRSLSRPPLNASIVRRTAVNDGRHRIPESWLATHRVRLIASDGIDLGVMTVAEALRRASDAGLKLVEVIAG